MHVVHGERASVAGLLGLEEEAAEELAAWRATHRDENADCEGCDPMRQVAFAYRTEAWELAVATAHLKCQCRVRTWASSKASGWRW